MKARVGVVIGTAWLLLWSSACGSGAANGTQSGAGGVMPAVPSAATTLAAAGTAQPTAPAANAAIASTVSTYAGSAGGLVNGRAADARFNDPHAIVIDAAGTIYVADSHNHQIRRITAGGAVSTFAGSTEGHGGFADGPGPDARFAYPIGLAIDGEGVLYVSDFFNHRIRKITPDGTVSTLAGNGVQGFADGSGTLARFADPWGIAVDVDGTVYVADSLNNRVRRISSKGEVTTVAGSGERGFADGQGSKALFASPRGLAIDWTGDIYVTDYYNNRVRRVTRQGAVSTVAGGMTKGFNDGTATAAVFAEPLGVTVGRNGELYIADSANNRLRRITVDGIVATVAGSGQPGVADGAGSSAQFQTPRGVAVDSAGAVYVLHGHRIRKVVLTERQGP